MQYHISDKMASLKPSAIREIFKYTGAPGVISLAGGNPAPEALPVRDIQQLMGEVLADNPMQALLYSQSEGHPPLRDETKRFIAENYGVFREGADELIIVSGAQQCMDLACKVLCNEGDTVICEDPSFVGALNCFRSYNVNLVGVPLQDDGIDLDRLEAALKANPNTRFLYLIPNFQNPTGITTSIEKRKAVYALAKRYGTLILEDNPYGDLRFEGEDVPAIKTLDEDGIVLYAGTFSKILSTGIRVGYLVMPAGLTSPIVVAKQCTDVHTGMLAQLLCHRFLTKRDMNAHIRSSKGIYAHKCRLMLQEMDKQFPKSVTYTRPSGGLFIWATLPDGLDGQEIATRLIKEKKVCVVPGGAFLSNQDAPSSSLRFNFTMSTDEQIVQGISLTAELLNEIC